MTWDRARILLGLATLAALAQPAAARAQAVLPGPAQMPQIQRQFEPQPAPRTAPDALPLAPQALPEAAGGQAAFLLTDIVFEGMTVYTPEQARPLYDGLLGRVVTLDDVQRVAQSLTDRYRSDGYLLSVAVVPAQTIGGGRVVVQVVEGNIDRAPVSGRIDGPVEIPAGLAAPAEGARPLDADTLERSLLLIGDLPGVNVQGVLRPSASQFGAADLDIVLQQTPAEGFVSLDNQGSRFLGPYALAIGGSLYSRLGRYEQIDGLLAFDPFDGTMWYASGAVTVPLHQLGAFAGDTLQIAGGYGQAKPDLPLFPFSTRSRSSEWRFTYAAPLIRSRDRNLTGAVAFIIRDLENRITDLRRDARNPAEEHVRLLQPRATFDWTTDHAVNLVELAANIGLDILDASQKSDPRLVRENADGQFFYLTATLARTQDLGGGFGLLARGDFQYSGEPLPTTERFGVGGSRYGAGFPPGNITGDSGVAARLELRYGRQVDAGALDAYQLYVHYDYGGTQDEAPGMEAWREISAIGAGVRINLFRNLAVNPEVAQQLTGDVADCVGCSDETRFLFSLTQRF